MSRPILLASDGSDFATGAARHAIDLADERDARLHVLCVVDRRVVDEPGLSSAESATIEAENHGHDCVAEVARLAEGTGVEVEGEVRHGIPHELIREFATEVDAVVVVIGEHGDHATHLGGVGRKFVEELEGVDPEVVVVATED